MGSPIIKIGVHSLASHVNVNVCISFYDMNDMETPRGLAKLGAELHHEQQHHASGRDDDRLKVAVMGQVPLFGKIGDKATDHSLDKGVL